MAQPTINPALFARYRYRIEPCIAQAAANNARVSLRAHEDGAKIFAEPQPPDGIAWGVNDPKTGAALLRGRRLPDGSDAP
jgi:hypothetical protein